MDNRLVDMLVRDTQGARHVVDYGCGDMGYLAALRHIPCRVGVDIVWPTHGSYDPEALFIPADMTALTWAPAADVCLLLDSIEHVKKPEGVLLLSLLQSLAGKIIVFTPNGFWDNHAGEAADPTNPYLKHLSGWTESDFPEFSVTHCPDIGSTASLYAVWER